MEEGGRIDRRTRRFGRVVAFRVRLPNPRELPLAERETRLTRARFERKEDRLLSGFEDPQVVRGVLCTRYVEEEKRVVEYPGENQVVWIPRYTSHYDLLGDSKEGYILVGRSKVAEAELSLAIYLGALGLEEEKAGISPLILPDAALKGDIFRFPFEPKGTQGGREHHAGLPSDGSARTHTRQVLPESRGGWPRGRGVGISRICAPSNPCLGQVGSEDPPTPGRLHCANKLPKPWNLALCGMALAENRGDH